VLNALLAEEPFVKAGKMRFCRITEFHPAQFQPSLQDWFGGAAAESGPGTGGQELRLASTTSP
jgi:hypothetical protein